MHMLVEQLEKEIEKYEQMAQDGELSSVDWKCVFEAVKGYKDILTAMAMRGEDMDGEYSERNYNYGGMYPMYNYNNGGSNRSYANGGNRSGGSNRGRSGGNSRYARNGNKEHIRRQLESLMSQIEEMED